MFFFIITMESLQCVIELDTNCLYHYSTPEWGMLILLQSLYGYHSVSVVKPWHLFLQISTKQGNSLYISRRCMLKYQYVVWPAAYVSESDGGQKLFFLKSQIFKFLNGSVFISFSYSVHIRLLEDCARISRQYITNSCVSHYPWVISGIP